MLFITNLIPMSTIVLSGLDFKAKLCHFIPNFDLKISKKNVPPEADFDTGFSTLKRNVGKTGLPRTKS
jgi:hypothetical protein